VIFVERFSGMVSVALEHLGWRFQTSFGIFSIIHQLICEVGVGWFPKGKLIMIVRTVRRGETGIFVATEVTLDQRSM
jgi:hypothetical protein